MNKYIRNGILLVAISMFLRAMSGNIYGELDFFLFWIGVGAVFWGVLKVRGKLNFELKRINGS